MIFLRNLKLQYGERFIFRGASASIGPDDRIGLVGSNGAGKTTIFNLLSGVYDVDSGSIVLDGGDITRTEAHDRVLNGLSRSFQNIRLMPHLSTVENVMLGQQATSRGWRDMI